MKTGKREDGKTRGILPIFWFSLLFERFDEVFAVRSAELGELPCGPWTFTGYAFDDAKGFERDCTGRVTLLLYHGAGDVEADGFLDLTAIDRVCLGK